MKLGAERNKLILLAVLSLIAAASVYTQFFAGSDPAVPSRRPAATKRTAAPARPNTVRRERATRGRARGRAFRPRFGGGDDSGEPLDPMTVDPTLRTDLLAKVRAVEFQGVERNVFRFGERKPKVKPPSKEELEKAAARLNQLPKPAAKPRSAQTKRAGVKPKAPPIKWKYYGFANSSTDARKRAFLLGEEDEVFIATEGDVFKKRYRIVRIGVNSIVVEDMQFKDRQTLPLQES